MPVEYLIVGLAALLASGLTLFSGFGLGTVLMPVFAIFFPVPVAIAATAIVHLANNVFKLALLGRHADWGVVLRFSLPAVVAAVLGARALFLFAGLPTLASYELAGRLHEVTVLKAVVGALVVVFAIVELVPRFEKLSFPPRYLLVGGLLSGFFGGLTGNQGAFRSAFLIRAGLEKDAFVGTSVVSTVIVDVARLLVYGVSFYASSTVALERGVAGPAIAAMLSAFLGAYLGARLLEKVTLRFVQIVVATAMMMFGAGLGVGLV